MRNPVPFILLFFILPFLSYSQDETISRDSSKWKGVRADTSLVPDTGTIMLIPFEPNMYQSNFDKEIHEETGLTDHQIKKRIRFGLDNELLARLNEDFRVVSFMRENDPDRNYDLKRIYNSIGFKYEKIPEEDVEAVKKRNEEEKSPLKKLFGGGKKKESSKENQNDQRRAVKEGQIVTERDEVERFMNAKLISEELLPYLNKTYGAGYYLFINQLDIQKSDDAEQYEIAKDDYNKRIKVHYTIVDHKGKELHGGAALIHYPSKVRDLNTLIKEYFSKAADHIADRVRRETGKKEDGETIGEEEPVKGGGDETR